MDGIYPVKPVSVVVIGRNEGKRLTHCLESIVDAAQIVYVDSGSTDGSNANASAMGAKVLSLDPSLPFTAARARNLGRTAVMRDISYIQFVDGDCTLREHWLGQALNALAADDGLAAVFGRRRERAPGSSRYNWLCDIEWARPQGEARYFGGDVMLRASAFDEVGGYAAEMIAGEDPDFSIRLRSRGWRIACLPSEMTYHDAAITRFAQWWRRAERSGHAYAELASRHFRSPYSDYVRRLRGVLFWGGALPIVAIVLAAVRPPITMAALCLPVLQLARLIWRERSRGWRAATTLAVFTMLSKPAQTIGAIRFWITRARGRHFELIEYKDAP